MVELHRRIRKRVSISLLLPSLMVACELPRPVLFFPPLSARLPRRPGRLREGRGDAVENALESVPELVVAAQVQPARLHHDLAEESRR